MIRGADGRFKAVNWRDALAVVAEVIHQVKPEEIVGVTGKLSDAESMMALKDFLNRMGSNNVWCEGNGKNPNADLHSGYLLNTSKWSGECGCFPIDWNSCKILRHVTFFNKYELFDMLKYIDD